ncbi:hypothetical protein, partial [Paenibacillus ferrarius]|uniref:hypothetical protein n=1 Tax=Paenibacillus ferrarius TaxID=1469647 RepID=UPI003D2C4E15
TEEQNSSSAVSLLGNGRNQLEEFQFNQLMLDDFLHSQGGKKLDLNNKRWKEEAICRALT